MKSVNRRASEPEPASRSCDFEWGEERGGGKRGCFAQRFRRNFFFFFFFCTMLRPLSTAECFENFRLTGSAGFYRQDGGV